MTKKQKATAKSKKQFMNDILPILEELDFDEIRKAKPVDIEKHIYKNGLWYRLAICMIGGLIEIVMSRTNNIASKFDVIRRPYPIIYESCWVYLTKECSPRFYPPLANIFGENRKYYLTDYKLRDWKRNLCVYCDTSIYSSFKTHLLRPKHKQNVKKYIEMLENVLKLNGDVVKYIYSFLEEA